MLLWSVTSSVATCMGISARCGEHPRRALDSARGRRHLHEPEWRWVRPRSTAVSPTGGGRRSGLDQLPEVVAALDEVAVRAVAWRRGREQHHPARSWPPPISTTSQPPQLWSAASVDSGVVEMLSSTHLLPSRSATGSSLWGSARKPSRTSRRGAGSTPSVACPPIERRGQQGDARHDRRHGDVPVQRAGAIYSREPGVQPPGGHQARHGRHRGGPLDPCGIAASRVELAGHESEGLERGWVEVSERRTNVSRHRKRA